jgi:ABC-type Zn uptake system ZnuABC Zn-binding protein ZnuA
MEKRILALLSAAMLMLTSCAPKAIPQREDDGVLTIVATTYPIYLFASSLTEHLGDSIVVERLDTGSTSCLHDYNLTVNDMKKLERADVIAINGAGLEEFMEDALHTSDAVVIDCSVGVELLENESHHHDEHDHSHDGHDHGHFDPHYWMDPRNARTMVRNLANGLGALDGERAELFDRNCEDLEVFFLTIYHNLEYMVRDAEISCLITFHDGFRYFAHAYDLPLLESIEEEAGSEASAKEIVEITELVQEHDIPVIFTEVNGSEATAKAVARETGCAVAQLSMLMSAVDGTIEDYRQGMLANMEAVLHGFGEETA